MQPLIEKLVAAGPVVTDGGWGTELQARGLPMGDFPDAWNLTHPQAVLAVAHAYMEAGSQVILTNTFGSNRIRLAEAGLGGDALRLNQRAVEISKEAASGEAFVFASIGPSGKLLLSGDVSPADLRAAFGEQCRALADAGADALVVESMSEVEEAKIALTAAKGSGLPVIACMVFDSGRDKDRTMTGQTPEEVASELIAAGADVIGANCGRGIEGFAAICARLASVASPVQIPIWIKPNAGLPVLENGRAAYRTTPDEFASHVPALQSAGADFIGGCCGTNPHFIRATRATIQNSKPSVAQAACEQSGTYSRPH